MKTLLLLLGIGLSANLYAQGHGKKEEQQDARQKKKRNSFANRISVHGGGQEGNPERREDN